MYKVIDFCNLFFYCTLIYWLSNQESLPTPHWFSFEDKLHHTAAYAVMAFLAWRSFRHRINNKPIILALVTLGFCSLYGVSDEWHQSFVVGRYSSVGDWIADTLGAAIACVALLKYSSFSKKICSLSKLMIFAALMQSFL